MSQIPPRREPPVYTPNYQTPPPDNTIATIIPYRNAPALISYYLGLFSLFPCLGGPMGIVAVVLGIKGLKRAKQYPEAKGKVHAIIGIVCGSIFGALNLACGGFIVFGMIMANR